MRAYVPTDVVVAAAAAAVWGAAAAIGFLLARLASVRAARIASWTLLVLGTLGVDRLCAAQPPGFRMVALATFALIAMKSIVVTEERARGLARPSMGTWIAFALGWVGMQPRLFARPRRALGGAGDLLASGAVAVVAGAVAIALARAAWTSLHSRMVATVLLLAGLSALVHFGLLNLLAAAWRASGAPVDALFRAPWRAQSLAEFWARRWNLAFSEMTSAAVYRPLAGRLGRGPGLLAGFAMSGLLHELAISLPVRAGFGLPLAYFLIHGSLVAGERALAARGRPVAGAWGRAWTVFWLVAPLPLLFHRPFLAGVAWPLIGIPAEG
jgi:membrane bound O-acyltransferase family protein